jgi:heme-degrading monooxygenase HmoA
VSFCLGTAMMQSGSVRAWGNRPMDITEVAARVTTIDATKKPRIARIWRGRVKREKAAEFQKYNYEFGIKPLIEKAMGVQALREDRESETEFITISYWESVEAMSRYTGGDPTKIHHLPRDPEFLIEIPKTVQILSIY